MATVYCKHCQTPFFAERGLARELRECPACLYATRPVISRVRAPRARGRMRWLHIAWAWWHGIFARFERRYLRKKPKGWE